MLFYCPDGGQRLSALTTDTPPGPVESTRPALRRALVALCVTEITSWGVLYYAFPVLLGAITTDTGWSTTAIMGGFSVGLAVSAIAGIPVGRLLDKHGPRPVMTIGSIIGVVSVVAIAMAPNQWWFIAAWALSGLAQACVFYKPAFAALTGWYGPQRVKALTALTLVAGLSSTIFAPATAFLADRMSWQQTYLILAVVLAVTTIPAHLFFLTPPWRPEQHHDKTTPDQTSETKSVTRSPAFAILIVTMALATFGLFAATVNLVPLLTEGGASTTFAAWALGLCGAGQLLGRIGFQRLVLHTSVRTRTVAVLLAAAVSIAAIATVGDNAVIVVTVAVIFGAARGIFTLLEATAISDRWGTRNFGTLYGLYSAPSTIAMAATPWVGAIIATWLGGFHPLFYAMATVLLVAGIAAIATIPRRPPT